ncbi:hypothetical protein [Methylobacterium isbiliense]|uniref:Uncharacterized protein n=1 Tax=Methylobacterium isbiliense TaxID=315478 RepID=A0ABQ4SK70_9HYPH|nr:hypothetical protein [Methylobacterium isbiliense]MDN3627160.1 hypothetical protein [Methylobacterium isbiliense]GJE03585.1 hypothetical protein GMJLKIPL_5542 [Methylobacterium isbiliense]
MSAVPSAPAGACPLPDEVETIAARLAALAVERARLEYVDDFAFWGARSRAIDAEVLQLQARRAALAHGPIGGVA